MDRAVRTDSAGNSNLDAERRATRRNGDGRARRIAFLFAGQGAQYEGMGEELFVAHPVFREALEECHAVLADELKPGLLDVLYGPAETRALVHRVEYGNPVFFALEWALTRLWISWDVTPAYVIGHSVGEYAAACVADVLRMEDAIRIVARIGELLQSLPPGTGMLAVGARRDRVEAALASERSGASIAAVNGPASLVLAGETAEIDRLATRFEAEGVRTSMLKVTCAFHSPHMNPVLDDLRASLRSVQLGPPSIPYISCLTGTLVHDELHDLEYWTRHLANPIRFLDGVRALLAEAPTHFIEIGPGATLLRMGHQCAPDGQGLKTKWIPSLGPDGSDCAFMAAGLATVNGHEPETARGPTEVPSAVRAETMALVRGWVARLTRVPEDEAQLHQPLGDSGMDSFMVAEFVEEIERETSVRLPVNLMASNITIAEVSAYIDARSPRHREGPSADDPVLVPFREGGGRLPLHFVPAGDGDLYAFQNVVDRLDPDQPVYGLQPPRIATLPSLRQKPVQRLVAKYLDQVERVQAKGPYRLAGYSVGGIIAVEMARELVRRGKAVDLLLLLDCPPHISRWVGVLHAGLRRICNSLRLPGLARRRNIRWLKRRLHAVLDEGLHTHVAATRNYEVAPYPGRIIYFRARRSWIRALDAIAVGRSWQKVAREGLEIREATGTHYGMFRGPNLDTFAAGLEECLKRGD